MLEMAVDRDPLSPVAHYTVGNVYVSIIRGFSSLNTLISPVQAVLMMYNKSVESFDHAISLSQDLDWVKKRRAAVLVRMDSQNNNFPNVGPLSVTGN